MGIRGLTRFINERFTEWKKDIVQGELIIDAYSLFYEFMRDDNDFETYGGDYMSLGLEIENFLKTLMKCKVKPFFIFDGITDDKKITLAARIHQVLESAVLVAERTSRSSSSSDLSENLVFSQTHSNGDRILAPHLMAHVMIDTLKRVVGGDCLFFADGDADIDIASLAIRHRCPVLSNDSDFYVFPLQYGYIPYSKFHWNSPQNNVIYAELYFYELFCEQFGICDSSLLAVIPAIIGNDMIPQIEAEDRKKILQPDSECNSLTESVIMYTASFTKLEACISTLQKQELIDPTDVIENIQEAYNDYFFVPCKFCKPLNILTTTLKCKDGSPFPEFVLKKFRVGVFSSFFIRIFREREMYKIVMEDVSESWCQLVGVPIRRVIYGILCGSNAFIKEFQRGENPLKYDKIQIKSVVSVTYDGKEIALPSLQSCGLKIDKNYGKKILFGILDVKEQDFKKIPTNYHLLLAITRYWYKHCTISNKDFLLKAFLLNLQWPMMSLNITLPVSKDGKQCKRGSSQSSSTPLFPIPSFMHAFAQWQSLYHDVCCLSRLLQEPVMLLPVSEFLECSYLHKLVEVMKTVGVKKVVEHNSLDQNLYLNFLSTTCPTEESISYW